MVGAVQMAVENQIYPRYIDAAVSRGGGRRVPRADAVEDPTVEEIAAAVRQIGYTATVEPEVCHPREVSARGRVRVQAESDESKREVVLAVAAIVGVLRG
jgi:signal recognition particle subunit SRP19